MLVVDGVDNLRALHASCPPSYAQVSGPGTDYASALKAVWPPPTGRACGFVANQWSASVSLKWVSIVGPSAQAGSARDKVQLVRLEGHASEIRLDVDLPLGDTGGWYATFKVTSV